MTFNKLDGFPSAMKQSHEISQQTPVFKDFLKLVSLQDTGVSVYEWDQGHDEWAESPPRQAPVSLTQEQPGRMCQTQFSQQLGHLFTLLEAPTELEWSVNSKGAIDWDSKISFQSTFLIIPVLAKTSLLTGATHSFKDQNNKQKQLLFLPNLDANGIICSWICPHTKLRSWRGRTCLGWFCVCNTKWST